MQAPPSPAATVLRYQSSLQDHASRLAGQVEGLASTVHERDQEIAQLSQMLQELRQKGAKKKVGHVTCPQHARCMASMLICPRHAGGRREWPVIC